MARMTLAGLALVSIVTTGCESSVDAEPASEAAARERLLGKAECEDVFTGGPLERGEDVDCLIDPKFTEAGADIRLVATGAAIPADAADATGTLRVEVARLDGTSLQVIEEAGLSDYYQPALVDIDGAGELDLLITRDAPRNSVWAVWISTHDGTYARAGELAGVTIEMQPDRIIAVPAASSADTWEIGYYFTSFEDTLEEIGRVEMKAVVDENGEFANRWTCRVLSTANPDGDPDYLCGLPAATDFNG